MSQTLVIGTPLHFLGVQMDGDSSEQMQEHWSGLRKPSRSPSQTSTQLCGCEEVPGAHGTCFHPLSTE